MSYCRCNDTDSDVYAIHCTDGYWQIWVAQDIAEKLNILRTGFPCNSLAEFKNKLVELKGMGIKIPDRVFDRIDREMSETYEGCITAISPELLSILEPRCPDCQDMGGEPICGLCLENIRHSSCDDTFWQKCDFCQGNPVLAACKNGAQGAD